MLPLSGQKRRGFCILPRMFSPHSQVTRSLVLLLPLSFVWLFVACVALCGTACAGDEHDEGTVETFLLRVAHDSSESDCCPIMTTPEGALPERLFSSHYLDDGLSRAPVPTSSVRFAFQLSSLSARQLIRPSSPNPPFNRLRTLRI